MTETAPCCLLPPDALAERGGWLREHFAPHVTEVERLERGYRYWLERTPERLRALADFVAFETRCCPHRDYAIVAPARGDRVALDITDPEGVTPALLPGVTAASSRPASDPPGD